MTDLRRMDSPAPDAIVCRGPGRFTTRTPWLESRHSFSFGDHYDPANTHHGALLVSNDETVSPGMGFDTHPHRDTEIVTWVLSGSLVHQDSMGHTGVIHPGLAQRMTAGSGIVHSERNDSWRVDGRSAHADPVRFVQMWVMPDESGVTPGYEQTEIDEQLISGGFVTVATGMPRYVDESAVRIRNRNAAMRIARLRPGDTVTLPDGAYVHVYVALGAIDAEGVGPLAEGDALRLRDSGGRRVESSVGAEIIVWETHSPPV